MKIKICGLKRVEEIRCLNRLRPDFCGFVFAPESRRYLEKPQALELKKILSPAIPAVGVFVNAKPEAAAAYVREGIIDAIQLHGQEDEAYLSCLRRFTDAPVIQAFSVNTEADLRLAEKSSADLVLLDSGAGGTGKRFDWNLLENFSRPFLLAGGLNVGNVREAMKICRPWGLDISSGVETNGVKDPLKIETCIRRIRNV